MHRLPAAALLFATIVCGTSRLAGQDHTYGTDGTGVLHTGDDIARQEVRRVEATLYGNGGIDLVLSKGRERWIFRGSWYGSAASGSVGFRLDSGFELPADGSGRLYLRRDQLTRVDFRGSNHDGAFAFTFADERGDQGGPSGSEPVLDVTRAGDGDLDLGDDGDRLERARVLLTDDGRAELRLWGARRYTLTGRWSGTLASGRVRLQLTAWGRDDADLTGTINTSRRSGWDRFAVDGSAGDRRVRIRFSGEGDALDSGDQDERDPPAPKPVGTLDQTMRGAGELKLESGSGADLRAVRVNLRRKGKVDIYLEGSGPRLALHGKWSQRDNAPKIDLSITEGLGQKGTAGVGTLSIPDGATWERLTLTGRAGMGGWTLSFHATGPGHLTPDSSEVRPAPDDIRELGVTVKGDGTLAWPGVTQPTVVTQVRISLTADKRATIDVEGGKPAHFIGRWSRGAQPNQLELAITGGTIERLNATGTVTLDDKRAVVAVGFEGRQVHRLVKLAFRATPAPTIQPVPR
jgi:hypothetical protein